VNLQILTGRLDFAGASPLQFKKLKLQADVCKPALGQVTVSGCEAASGRVIRKDRRRKGWKTFGERFSSYTTGVRILESYNDSGHHGKNIGEIFDSGRVPVDDQDVVPAGAPGPAFGTWANKRPPFSYL